MIENYFIKTKQVPPGPKGLPLLGSLVPFFRDIIGFLRKVAEEYGDVAYFELGPRKIYMLSHPEDIQDVLITNNRNFSKSRALKRAKIVVGEGLLTSEKEAHLKNRRILQPVFHNKAIPQFADVMFNYTKRFTDRWQDGLVLDIHNEMMKITQAIVVKTLFGSEIGESSKPLIDSLTTLMNLFPRLLFPFSEVLDRLPLPSSIKCRSAINTLDKALYEIIEDRKNTNIEENYDLVSLLLNEEHRLSDKQIRDEVITFFIAGQETTSNALSWTWYLISKNRAVEEEICQELDRVLGDCAPGMNDLDRLEYVKNVFTESLRMYPPAWVVTRRAINDYSVRGYTIPAGSDIYMSQCVVHNDSRFYDNPQKFDPDRWKDGKLSNLPRFAYFPFGGGTRRCIGEPFAIMEAVLVIAAFASKWRLRMAPDFKVKPQPLITLRPKHGLKMIVEKR